MTIKKVILFRHILVWAIYILYEMALIDSTVGLKFPAYEYATFYVCNIVLFYVNAHVILDYAFFKTSRPYLTAIFLIMVEIIIYLGIKILLDGFFKGNIHVELTFNAINEKIWLTNVFREIFLIGFSIAYWSMLYMVRFKDRNHAMEKEHLQNVAATLELENKYITAENAYLQNQISPHLLFNTLNFLYNSIHRLSDRAGKGVMLLSDIMRYSLISSADQKLVPLKAESEQIEKLIELTSLRFGQDLFIRFTKKGNLTAVKILPLILVTLVENMIKHGDLGEATQPGTVRLSVSDGQLKFETANKKRLSTPHPSNGIGLVNIRKRLTNHYQNRHQFDIVENENDFTVSLTLSL